MPQRSRKRPTALRELDAARVGVEMSAPSRQPSAVVDDEQAIHHDDAQEF